MSKLEQTEIGPGTAMTRRVETRIFETSYSGRMTSDMVDKVRKDLEPLLRGVHGACWLADTTHVTSYAPAPRPSVTAFLEMFKTSGGKCIAVVITSAPLRMLVSAFRFATGLPMRTFATRDEALTYLRTETGS